MLQEVLLPFGKTILQYPNQGVSSDSKLLFDEITINTDSGLNCLELGSGNGIISLMLANYHPDWQIQGIDIQTDLVNLSQKNATICQSQATFFEADLKDINSDKKYDIIFSNPPFFQRGKFRLGDEEARNIARHEIMCQMPDVFAAVKRNLKPFGEAYLIYPRERLAQIETEAKKVDLILMTKKILNHDKKVIVRFKHASNVVEI